VDQARNVRETAALARRFVFRTLTVVGGAAAGTAIAWCLSTGTAAADTPADLLGDTSSGLTEVVTPFGDTLDALAERLPAPPSPPREALDRLTETAERLGDQAELPEGELTGVLETAAVLETVEVPVEAADFGSDQVGAPPWVPAAASAGSVTDAGVDPEWTTARTATERAYATGMPHRGSPATTLPDQPTWPAPFSPVPPSAPVSGHTGHAGANLADSSPSAALVWLDRTSRPGSALTAHAAEAATAGRAGDQPGTAPD
jgi:hypothetical protein